MCDDKGSRLPEAVVAIIITVRRLDIPNCHKFQTHELFLCHTRGVYRNNLGFVPFKIPRSCGQP
jgi:hypothetical protein